MARKATLNDSKAKVAVLKTVAAGNYGRKDSPVSYYQMRKLMDDGLVVRVTAPKVHVKGKNPLAYVLSGKGKNLVTLSSRWVKKDEVSA